MNRKGFINSFLMLLGVAPFIKKELPSNDVKKIFMACDLAPSNSNDFNSFVMGYKTHNSILTIQFCSLNEYEFIKSRYEKHNSFICSDVVGSDEETKRKAKSFLKKNF